MPQYPKYAADLIGIREDSCTCLMSRPRKSFRSLNGRGPDLTTVRDNPSTICQPSLPRVLLEPAFRQAGSKTSLEDISTTGNSASTGISLYLYHASWDLQLARDLFPPPWLWSDETLSGMGLLSFTMTTLCSFSHLSTKKGPALSLFVHGVRSTFWAPPASMAMQNQPDIRPN